jgi:hypothetical protein
VLVRNYCFMKKMPQNNISSSKLCVRPCFNMEKKTRFWSIPIFSSFIGNPFLHIDVFSCLFTLALL